MARSAGVTARTADVVVIGAGIQGCAAALRLARRGRRVILVEKNTAGRHASGVNAGGVRRLLRHVAEVPLSLASMEIWPTLAEDLGADCGFQVSGQVAVAESEADFSDLRRRHAEMAALGYRHEELLSREELREVVPALSPHCVGGLICRGDGFASPYLTVTAFRAAAVAAGVTLLEGVRVTGARRRAGVWHVASDAGPIEGGFLLNCAGAWAGEVAGWLGEAVPLEPLALMMMVTDRMQRFVEPVVIGRSRKLSFKQMPHGSVMIGGGYRGTPDLAQGRSSVDFRQLMLSARTVAELFPVMREASILRCWSGIESRLPDDIPVLGPSATEPGAFHAFGFAGHGFQFGPIVGELLAQLVEAGVTQLPIAPFAITRFGAAVQEKGSLQ